MDASELSPGVARDHIGETLFAVCLAQGLTHEGGGSLFDVRPSFGVRVLVPQDAARSLKGSLRQFRGPANRIIIGQRTLESRS